MTESAATPRLEGASDVVIVGAGPAGCAAGIVLARGGAKVAVIDRARFPRDKTCGDAVSNDGWLLVEQLGAGDAVKHAPHALVRRAAAVFPDGARIERDYDRPGYIIPRYHFDDCLRRALEASGATLFQGRRVASLTRDGERVTGAEGPNLAWSARIAIAADGYGSLGLAGVGARAAHGRYLGISATAYYRGVTFPYGLDTADHYFEPELPYGYGWIFPAVDGVTNLGVYLRADAYARAGQRLDQLLAGFLARRADRLRSAEAQGKPRVWSLPLAPRPLPHAAPGLLLAGDAGGFVDPLSGEGIWQALHTGVLAGEVALRALARGELDAGLRDEYERGCARAISRPSRAKAAVQSAMALIVDRGLYRSRLVRSALAFGYRRRALEMTKS